MHMDDQLLARVCALVPTRDRVIVGIAGPPAAGKSTLARALVVRLRAQEIAAAYLPMDGYHLSNAELQRLGRLDRKGAPDTFDAQGYLALLARLRHCPGHVVYAPDFNRTLEEPIAGSIALGPEVSVIVTEGNYLLLDDAPWPEVRRSLDEVWYLAVPGDVRRRRLVERQEIGGKDRASAEAWADGSDARNAALVEAVQAGADLIITPAVVRS